MEHLQQTPRGCLLRLEQAERTGSAVKAARWAAEAAGTPVTAAAFTLPFATALREEGRANVMLAADCIQACSLGGVQRLHIDVMPRPGSVEKDVYAALDQLVPLAEAWDIVLVPGGEQAWVRQLADHYANPHFQPQRSPHM